MMVSGQVHTLTNARPEAAEAPELVWTFSRRKISWTYKDLNPILLVV